MALVFFYVFLFSLSPDLGLFLFFLYFRVRHHRTKTSLWRVARMENGVVAHGLEFMQRKAHET